MQSPEVLNKLWAGIVYKQELDFLLQRAIFYIRTQDNELYTYYELIFEEILIFSIKNLEISSWRYIELSELYYSQDKHCNFEILLWDEDYTVNITCKSWKLNLIKQYNESD